MSLSETVIANLALSHLGIGKNISNVETERTPEANACRQFYETARNATLRDFKWPFTTKIVALNLVEEDPNDEWDFSYRYPSDCLFFRRILSGSRNDSNDSEVPFRVISDDTSQLILTNNENAYGEYTRKITDTGLFPDDFTLTLSFRLAAYIAPRITKGDQFRLVERCMRGYMIEGGKATKSAANEESPDREPDSEFIRTRE